MRLIFVIILFIGTITPSLSQDSPIPENTQEQIKAVVRSWVLNRTLEDPGSYKGDEFYDMERVIDLSPAADSAYHEWINTEFALLKDVFTDTTGNEMLSDSARQAVKRLEEEYNQYEKEHVGYKVKHKFHAKSPSGDTHFYEAEFIMDREFNMLETSVKERATSDQKTG